MSSPGPVFLKSETSPNSRPNRIPGLKGETQITPVHGHRLLRTDSELDYELLIPLLDSSGPSGVWLFMPIPAAKSQLFGTWAESAHQSLRPAPSSSSIGLLLVSWIGTIIRLPGQLVSLGETPNHTGSSAHVPVLTREISPAPSPLSTSYPITFLGIRQSTESSPYPPSRYLSVLPGVET